MNFSDIDPNPGIVLHRARGDIQCAWVRVSDATESPCDDCPISFGMVPPRGSINPEYYFIGEAPGKTEEQEKKPFIGPAGKLLDAARKDAGIQDTPSRWFNVVACRPTKEGGKTRTPTLNEARNCMGFLLADMKKYKPAKVVLLGKVPTLAFMSQFGADKNDTLATYRSRLLRGWNYFKGKTPSIMSVWHPAYVLRKGGIGTEAYNSLVRDLCHLRDHG